MAGRKGEDREPETKLSCDIPVKIKNRLKVAAATVGMDMKDIAALAIDTYLDDLEGKKVGK
ncbi:hypothetical protein [Fictibacillus sp. NRS-1165]|uniref:hypothetical protein n=1 Tax=Fictibacillus sp. NRS-1165 TaxID=3144463 RepID=UPI003D258842